MTPLNSFLLAGIEQHPFHLGKYYVLKLFRTQNKEVARPAASMTRKKRMDVKIACSISFDIVFCSKRVAAVQ